MNTNLSVDGFDEIVKFLKTFPDKVERRILRGGLRKAAMVIKQQAQSIAPTGETGVLKRAIAVRVGRKPIAQVYIKSGGKSVKHDGWYQHLVIKGTKAHSLFPGANRLRGKLQNKPFHHGGSKGNPFMDKAKESANSNAVKAMAQYMADAIKKEVYK